MLDKPLALLTKADLETLVTNRRSEDRGLDYKRELNLARDDDRRELARDILAFANSVGGDLLFGVEEERDGDGKSTGVPSAIVGVECNFDQTKQRMESILRDLIDPRVPGIMIEKVEGFEHGPVVVVRVPRSWAAPHMLKFQNQTHFFSRNSAGRYPMDVREIRSAFAASGELEARVRRFRDERLGRLVGGETPIALRSDVPIKVVTHAIPFASENVALDFEAFDKRFEMPPPYVDAGIAGRYTFEGYVSYSPGTGDNHCYNHAFRTGAFEALTLTDLMGPRRPGGPPRLLGTQVEKDVHRGAALFVKLLRKNGFEGPIVLVASVIGVRGAAVSLGDSSSVTFAPEFPIDRDLLMLPDVLVEIGDADIEPILRPAFDAMWQAGGWDRSYGYDAQGKWLPHP